MPSVLCEIKLIYGPAAELVPPPAKSNNDTPMTGRLAPTTRPVTEFIWPTSSTQLLLPLRGLIVNQKRSRYSDNDHLKLDKFTCP